MHEEDIGQVSAQHLQYKNKVCMDSFFFYCRGCVRILLLRGKDFLSKAKLLEQFSFRICLKLADLKRGKWEWDTFDPFFKKQKGKIIKNVVLFSRNEKS